MFSQTKVVKMSNYCRTDYGGESVQEFASQSHLSSSLQLAIKKHKTCSDEERKVTLFIPKDQIKFLQVGKSPNYGNYSNNDQTSEMKSSMSKDNYLSEMYQVVGGQSP